MLKKKYLIGISSIGLAASALVWSLQMVPPHPDLAGVEDQSGVAGQSGIYVLDPSNPGKELCLDVYSDQKLVYHYDATWPVYFDLHFHDGRQVNYGVQLDSSATAQGEFIPEQKDSYCLYWQLLGNQPRTVHYQIQRLPRDPQTNLIRTDVRFQFQKTEQRIRVVDGAETERFTVNIGHPVLNFSLNHQGSLLAVLVSGVSDALRIYDVSNGSLRHAFSLEKTPRFIVFSNDDRFIALADEHSAQVTVIERATGKLNSLALPSAPQALAGEKEANHFLARLNGEIVKVQFEPLALVERRAKIALKYGDRVIKVDPEAVCFTHGIPHPLYIPIAEAMSEEGLAAAILLPKLPFPDQL